MPVLCENTQILHLHFDNPSFARFAHDAMIERPVKKSGKIVTRSKRMRFEVQFSVANLRDSNPADLPAILTSIRRAAIRSCATNIFSQRNQQFPLRSIHFEKRRATHVALTGKLHIPHRAQQLRSLPSEHGEEAHRPTRSQQSQIPHIRSNPPQKISRGQPHPLVKGSSTSSPRNFSASLIETIPAK